jgi:predicted RNase H-like nuclease
VKPRAGRPIVGVDGCRRGWVAVAENVAEKVCGTVYERFEDLLADLPSARVIAVDMPIGLLDKGARDCDLQARRRLGPRGSSVFPVPIRPVLEATTPEEASRIRNDVELSWQIGNSFHFVSKNQAREPIAARIVFA